MTTSLRFLACLALAAHALAASAQAPKDSNADLARQLVHLLRYEKQMDAYREQCANMAQSISPESLVKDNPEKFGGVTPANRHWPKVVLAYEQYYRDFCAHPTVSEFVDAMADVYSKELSAAELKAAVHFYSTSVGQRLTEGHRRASTAINTLISQAGAKEVPKALVTFDRRIEEIAREAEADKKCPPAKQMRANRVIDGGASLAQLRPTTSGRSCGG